MWLWQRRRWRPFREEIRVILLFRWGTLGRRKNRRPGYPATVDATQRNQKSGVLEVRENARSRRVPVPAQGLLSHVQSLSLQARTYGLSSQTFLFTKAIWRSCPNLYAQPDTLPQQSIIHSDKICANSFTVGNVRSIGDAHSLQMKIVQRNFISHGSFYP